ncbi:hypothetical protein [Pseudomonas sp. RL_5y_Pfl2_69]|uniref:hypothetical protein n=1 Tax=Pseudomonas sp. RL_5y_Pfl2_69 TaxID=3088711 RepID=UPI0030DC517E
MPKAKSKTHNFTNRGKHFGNIWASFSYKAKIDVELHSDIELGYWLVNLEFNSSVARYELHPLPRIVSCPKPRKIPLTAEIMTRSGDLEWHLLCSSQQYSPEVLKELDKYASGVGVRLRLFHAEDIAPHKVKIIPLLKACACLSSWQTVEVDYDTYHNLKAFIYRNKSGCLGDLFRFLDYEDQALICFLIARLCSEGIINLEILPGFFDRAACWEAS